VHDLDEEHYHDIGAAAEDHDDNVVWKTAGFDVGSSTTQVVFSQITLARHDAYYKVVDRTTLHQSEVILTPYAAPEIIDKVQLAAFIEREYASASVARNEVDTGAVILTGLALRAQNARTIADAIADESGRFVAVSAGDMLEARLAANGAGVPALSSARKGVVVHIDIGGGTTKLSAWLAGKLLGLAAIDVGARLVTVDASERVVRVEKPAAGVAEDLHLDLREGEPLNPAVAHRIAGALARNVLRYAGVLREPPRGRSLLRTEPLFRGEPPLIDAVVFSGGVSEYIYGRETRTFGDLGLLLGRAIRAEVEALKVKVLPFERGIRATVLGASQHSAQLSGNTIFVSKGVHLPLRNVPVVLPQLDLRGDVLDREQLLQSLNDALAMRAATGTAQHLSQEAQSHAPALAIRWDGSPLFERLNAVAESIAIALGPHLRGTQPCIVIVDGDVAGVLGARLQKAFATRSVICIDGVQVHEFDYVDIGTLVPRTGALPVVVKSLLFASPPRQPHHHHHHDHRFVRRL
jgi:ethanolamine utilization protein EutA